MKPPWDNCSSSRIWLKDHVGSLSPARPVMKKRQGVRGTQVPSRESPLVLAKESADGNRREATTEAELCSLTFRGPHLEELCFVSLSEICLLVQHLPSLIGASPSCILIKRCWQSRISITSDVWHMLPNSSHELLASGLADRGLRLILFRRKLQQWSMCGPSRKGKSPCCWVRA